MLTDYKTKKIMQFLKETLKTPLKYGEFMGKEWMEQLVKVLGLLNSHIMEVASKIVERWLETGCFQKVQSFYFVKMFCFMSFTVHRS